MILLNFKNNTNIAIGYFYILIPSILVFILPSSGIISIILLYIEYKLYLSAATKIRKEIY